MSPPGLSTTHKNRLVSILRQHALLFGRGLLSRSPAVESEDCGLIDALDDLSEGQPARNASILWYQELLSGRGMVLGQISRPVHYVLPEPFATARCGHPEWHPAAGAPTDDLRVQRPTKRREQCL